MVVKYISSWNAKLLRYTCRVGQIDLAVAKIRKSLKYGIVEERTRGYAAGFEVNHSIFTMARS